MSAAKPAAKKAAAKKSGSSLTYEDMIKQAIVAHASEARQGIGRATIKKYIQSHFPETAKAPEASFNTRVNQAITRGAAKKTFVLPKGPSGKVKLAPKEKASEKKAAAKPAAAKKPAAKPAAKKATTTAKKPAAKKTAVKKTTSSAATKAKKPAAKAKKADTATRTPLAPTQPKSKPAAKPAAKKAVAKKA